MNTGLYLKTDVLLLTDIFENFRDSCITSYGLDLAYYYTIFYVGRDVETRINFKLLTDVDMILIIERGIRDESMFKQVCTGQQQVHAVVRSIEIVNIPDVL